MTHAAYRDLERTTPLAFSVEERVHMGTVCRDADHLPRVPDAGKIIPGGEGGEGGGDVQIMHNGLRVVAGGYYGDWMADLIGRCQGVHEPQEEPVFNEVLKFLPANATMIELGAFWGFYSLWFLKDHPHRRSVLVEPDPHHLAIGRRNAQLNRAVLDPDQMVLLPGFVGPGEGGTAPFKTESAGEIELSHIRVPDLLDQLGIGTLDLLHCDAQGAELAVLEQSADLLTQGRIRFVFVSTHTHYISGDVLTHQRCLALLRGLGGRILIEHDVQESYSGDGLIVAYFGRDAIDWTGIRLSYNRYETSLFRNPLYDLAQAQGELARANIDLQWERKENAHLRGQIAQLQAQLDSLSGTGSSEIA